MHVYALRLWRRVHEYIAHPIRILISDTRIVHASYTPAKTKLQHNDNVKIFKTSHYIRHESHAKAIYEVYLANSRLRCLRIRCHMKHTVFIGCALMIMYHIFQFAVLTN